MHVYMFMHAHVCIWTLEADVNVRPFLLLSVFLF